MQWFYERNGASHGPVDENAIRKLYARGSVNDDTPVWPHDAPHMRTVLGATAIDLPSNQNQNTDRLHEYKTLPDETFGSDKTADSFFNDEIVRIFIGKNSDQYLNKWRNLILPSSTESFKTKFSPTINLGALFGGVFWFFYRKLWRHAFLLSVLIAFTVIIPDKFSRPACLGLLVFFGLISNSIYLNHTYNFWKSTRQPNVNPQIVVIEAKSKGGTSILSGFLGFIFTFLLMFFVDYFYNDGDLREIFSTSVSCGSKETISTVESIARDNMKNKGLGYSGINIENSKIFVDSIRTQSSGNIMKCAADIRYEVLIDHRATNDVASAQSSVNERIKSSITYTVQKTDHGKNIYVYVNGLF